MLSLLCIAVRAVPVLLAAIQCIRKGEERHFHNVELSFEQSCMIRYWCAHLNCLISSKAQEIGGHHVQHLLVVCYYICTRWSASTDDGQMWRANRQAQA